MVAPQPIENLLKCDPFISQAVLIGDRRKFISALIAADPQRLAAYAKEKGIPYTDLAELQDDPRIVELYRQCVASCMEGLSNFEKCAGVFARHFRQMVSRSRGTRLFRRLGRGGSSRSICSSSI